MADLPILMSAPMVRVTLREIEHPGTGKTQTRRVLSNDKPNSLFNGQWADSYVLDPGNQSWRDQEVRYAIGDRLYVREAHYLTDDGDHEQAVCAVDVEVVKEHLAAVERLEASHPSVDWSRHKRLRPGIHMPRWASRLTLTVTDVRVQRLQEISEADAVAEGIYELMPRDTDGMRHFGVPELGERAPTAARGFRDLWDSINAVRSCGWDTNPWVAAYTFRPVLGNIDQVRP